MTNSSEFESFRNSISTGKWATEVNHVMLTQSDIMIIVQLKQGKDENAVLSFVIDLPIQIKYLWKPFPITVIDSLLNIQL